MISKNLLKYIRSLEQKKARLQEGAFVAEGPKVVGDLMESMSPTRLIALTEWFQRNAVTPRETDAVVTEEELRRVSFLQHPQQVMAVFPLSMSKQPVLSVQTACSLSADDLFLALDGVQDPGNLGTIIRIADWFGITTLLCSHDTADAYNPKVVQATMGSIARVRVVYTDLAELFRQLPDTIPVYGTFLDGDNIYEQRLSKNGIIVMGNEGKGISADTAKYISHRIFLPNYPAGRKTADSLNVAIATAITCAEFRRR